MELNVYGTETAFNKLLSKRLSCLPALKFSEKCSFAIINLNFFIEFRLVRFSLGSYVHPVFQQRAKEAISADLQLPVR